jgi:hypothetical protein
MDDKGVNLPKGAFIHQQVDPLSGGQAAAAVLCFDALGAPAEVGLSA